MNIQKIVKIVALVIGLIAVFFLVKIMTLGDEAIKADAANQGVLSGFATLAYIVLAIAAITAIVSSLVNLISQPEKLKKSTYFGRSFCTCSSCCMVCIFRTRACTNGRFNINFRSISND
jgi:uncharacterized membrane protein